MKKFIDFRLIIKPTANNIIHNGIDWTNAKDNIISIVENHIKSFIERLIDLNFILMMSIPYLRDRKFAEMVEMMKNIPNFEAGSDHGIDYKYIDPVIFINNRNLNDAWKNI